MFKRLNLKVLVVIFIALLAVFLITKMIENKKGERSFKKDLVTVNIDDVEITGTYPTYTWLSLDGGISTSGTIPISSSEDEITVGFDSSGLVDSTYYASIVITSDDPDNPSLNVPVTLIVGSAPPEVPENLTIEINTTHVVLNWDAVPGATSYKVYSSDDPNEAFVDWDFEEDVTGTTWSELIPADYKFYQVTAVN